MVEGKSVMLTLVKNYLDENRIQKRINVKKMVLLKDLFNKPIKNITFKFKDVKDLEILNKLSNKNAETDVKIILNKNKNKHIFHLKNKRKINYELLNLLNLVENIVID